MSDNESNAYIVKMIFQKMELASEKVRLEYENKNLKMKVKALNERIKKCKETKIVLEGEGSVVILVRKRELLN